VDQDPPRPDWFLQPLVDAGLETEQIRALVFRLGFEVIVSDGCPTVTALGAVAADAPPAIKAAWIEVIDRLIA
jgi:hypothetical protein